MSELKQIVEDMEPVFADSRYPEDFLAVYDQMECLAGRMGKETFLVRRKDSGETRIATCYDLQVFPFRPDFSLAAGLKHPGLPQYYETFRNGKMICVIREYIEGDPLDAYVRDRQLSVPEIAALASKICDILEVLHTHEPPVIHRDIKPENIIVRPDGSVALIDFDLSRAVREDTGTDTVFFGTRGYAPPEQYGFGQTDNRADIYAFGVLLRWMVTGSERENRNISMDETLQRVIDRCTAFSPEERYTDIRQVRQELDRAGRRRFRISPKRTAAMILAGVLLLGAGFSAGRFTEWFRRTPKIVFQEPLIEQAVRMQAGKEKGTLTEEDLSAVSRIYIYGTEAFADPDLFYACSVDTSTEGPLRTLDDLALLPGLEELHIIHQGYVDVTGAAGLARLQTVELKHMQISGAEPLAAVPGLRNAILFCTGVSDVTAFENCPWLETLDIGLNDITETAQIGSHPNVRSLGLMWLKMDNVDDIAERLPKVQAVTLQHGEFGDLSGLRKLPDLEAVYVLEEQADEVKALFEGTDVQVTVTEN